LPSDHSVLAAGGTLDVLVRRALISVSDKHGIAVFARGLAELGVNIVSTSGTARVLKDSGLQVTDVSSVTGTPEMLDGRVKALHPRIHGGLLFLRNNEQHVKAIADQGIDPIDMVVVNLYSFHDNESAPEVALENAFERIDIGGHSIIRSGAKNYRSVAVVTDSSQYGAVLQEMKTSDGNLGERTLGRLMVKAFGYTAEYDTRIHRFLQSRLRDG
jgi:phosphoribosylaminoimidazolecarboxamide formyltransferase / IMP cyclohydrolase